MNHLLRSTLALTVMSLSLAHAAFVQQALCLFGQLRCKKGGCNGARHAVGRCHPLQIAGGKADQEIPVLRRDKAGTYQCSEALCDRRATLSARSVLRSTAAGSS